MLEILDLEAIYREVFDADVLPVIIIAENRPATEDNTVVFRLADKSCVVVEQSDAVPILHLDDLPEQRIPYPDIFTPDGRIMTRLTPARLAVLRKLWRHPTVARFAEAALIAEMEHRLDELDALVGTALGLSVAEIAFVRRESREDPFLARIRPRFPGTDTRRQGFRTGLDSAARYE